jgi:hypothetical protein
MDQYSALSRNGLLTSSTAKNYCRRVPKLRRPEPVDAELVLTTNQVIAYNFARAREEAGWTQVEASDRLEGYLGYRLNQAGVSSIERTFDSDRQRSFTASELVAFARCFKKPVGWFLLPPERMGRHFIDPISGSSWMRAHDLPALALGTPEAWASYVERLHEWLANDPADAWTGLRYAFNDRSDADQTSDNIGGWAGERRRELQLDVLRELASDVDRKIHELASLVDQLKATTLVGLLQQAESDPSALQGVAEAD